MPMTIEISPELEIVLTIFTGTITDQGILAHDRELEKMEAFKPNFHHIIDATAVTEYLISEAGILELAMNTPFSPDSRRAIVVGDSTAPLKASAFSKILSAPSDNMFVTQDREKAYAWLLGKLE